MWLRDLDSKGTQHLTHWGRVTHICVSKLTIIGLDNGLSPDRRQAIIWTNDGLLLIGPLEAFFSEILIEILTVSSEKMRLKVSSAKRRPFCLGLNVLMTIQTPDYTCTWWPWVMPSRDILSSSHNDKRRNLQGMLPLIYRPLSWCTHVCG